MAKNGRKKNVTGGSANVYKRGSGKGSGPVGRKDGYSARPTGGHNGGNRPPVNTGRPNSRPDDFGERGSSDNTRNSGIGMTVLSSLLGGALSSAVNSGNSQQQSSSGSGGSRSILQLLKTNKTARMIAIILVVLLVWYLISGGNCGGGCTMPSMTDYSDFSEYGVAGEVTTEQNADLTVSNQARDKRTVIKGDGSDTATIMVYICGSDLESKHGMATSDIKEMIKANVGENVRVILQTGGAAKWQNSTVSNKNNQIYRVTGQGLHLLQELDQTKMTDPKNLASFIKYCKSNYPADRYGLIFWDHGGGSVSGYGYDEKYKGDSMTLDEINTALHDGGCVFDFIGFDACLMATLETAMVAEKYSDYLIASEETEPGIGWYYTNWLSELSENPSISTVELGKKIIDDFVVMCGKASPRDKTTLSIVDLAELSGTVPESFASFASSTNDLIRSDSYKQVSDARSNAREFASGINQVDLVNLCEGIGSEEAVDFAKVLRKCVKYNRTSSNIANANGISIYFPYGRASNMNSALSTYDKIGLDDSYSDCIKSFASMSAGGQIASGTAGSLTDSLFGGGSASGGASLLDMMGMLGGGSQPSGGSNVDLIGSALSAFLGNSGASSITGIASGAAEDWFSPRLVTDSTEYYQQHYLDPDKIFVTELKDGSLVVDLTEKEWELVQDIQLNVFVEDEDGYIDLGMDNVYEMNEDGDLIFDYDNTWLTINGNVVSYYMISNDEKGDNYVITGRVPALLNGQRVDILLVFDTAHPDGVVAGARPVYTDETQTVSKGLIEIKEGDAIDFLCDHYSFDKSYDDSYFLGEQYIVEGELKVANMDIGDSKKLVTYCLTDIYGNELWTDAGRVEHYAE